MTNNYDKFISNIWKRLTTANCWFCSNAVLLRSFSVVPLALLWLSYRTLKWIRSVFEEGSKVMRNYTLLTDRSSLIYEIGLVTKAMLGKL